MDLFVALGDMEEQQLGGAVDPNPLREALSSDMKSHFRIGKACCQGGHNGSSMAVEPFQHRTMQLELLHLVSVRIIQIPLTCQTDVFAAACHHLMSWSAILY